MSTLLTPGREIPYDSQIRDLQQREGVEDDPHTEHWCEQGGGQEIQNVYADQEVVRRVDSEVARSVQQGLCWDESATE